jgi:hypothetical protein
MVQLLLMRWNHPERLDSQYAVSLLETVSDLLCAAASGDDVGEQISNPEELGFVEAIWTAESIGTQERAIELEWDHLEIEAHRDWLKAVRGNLSECFQQKGS